ncbi:MBL fold metallo-hydrolase [Saccharibacillus sacchari]|uniref:MBL fold metallo-hydrolase n=1 Tax=Saccharibacillus sacchari TaxID=456493 RepID=A0ACC6PJN8_9BACL
MNSTNSVYEVHSLKVRSEKFINYCYVIVDKRTKKAALIDPAWEKDRIQGLIDHLNVELTFILLTHSHHDHVNLVDEMVQEYKCRVYILHQEVTYYRFFCENLVLLTENSLLMLGDTEIQVIHTPGHTLGSACFLLEDCIFTGDTIFIEGCGVCDTDGGNPLEMYHTIQRLKKLIHLETSIYPGHCFGKEPGHSFECLLRNNIYFHFKSEEQFVRFRMRKISSEVLKFR